MKRHNAIVTVITLAALIVIASIAGMYGVFFAQNNNPLSVAVAAIAAMSFLGLLTLSQVNHDKWELTEESMRSAIAGSIVIVYLVLVGLVAFFKPNPETDSQKLPQITQTLVNNFTTVVGIVIAFYFGASAYVQTRKKPDASPPPPPQ